jgi:shikimate dehydrogenase
MSQITHRCAVLGKPIVHSLSPVLHKAAYRYIGLTDWVYGRREIGEEELGDFLSGIDDTWRGLSLTMPLKHAIQPFGVPADKWSRELHISNTAVFNRHECAEGNGNKAAISLYNTDIKGIQRAFQRAWNFSVLTADYKPIVNDDDDDGVRRGANAVILGNGNTALSALAALTEMMVPNAGKVTNITVCARNLCDKDALRDLADRHQDEFDYQTVPLSKAPAFLCEADIVVSTIPAGGADVTAQDFSDLDMEVSGALLDVVYDPRPTQLMRAWSQAGGTAIGGEWMLLYQAVAQVLLMTNQRMPPRPVMMDSTIPSCRTDAENVSGLDVNGLERAMETALREAL